MAIANVHFDEYLLVRKNLLISSKSIKPESLDDILGDILKKETTITSFFKYADVIIEPNRIEYVANVDGRSGNDSNL
ncbi:Colanic acid capsular biosynthesis activation accesory protein RcsA, co-regulator with RcsB [Escherichia coli ISC7]|uniref:Colanic acid capsular biosynthesis activation accesory protein RcsA, co-regulator with RcsB n=1 Tax=Escherichia coli ISC7 TaxID=1432555 RepID=W1F554_ECOLX|nr:Colanic acid capsular biosynthesis activation accesory protein RcsA, co-regulator with RcsB [Escherichia coli ISC7]